MNFDSIIEIQYTEKNPHRLGKGGYGSVYLVEHPEYHYKRALKVINTDDVTEEEKRKSWDRFFKECHVLFQLGNGSHPNIIRIHQITKFNQHPAMELEYIIGKTLHEYITRTKFIDFDEIVKFINHIVSAVAYCHVDVYRYNASKNDARIELDEFDGNLVNPRVGYEEDLIKDFSFIHNDLHPKNIMRREIDGAYILIDFGIAWQNERPVNSIISQELGYQEYRAPEYRKQHVECNEAIKANPNTTVRISPEKNWDVYSLGAILYELFTGNSPKRDMTQMDENIIYEQRKNCFESVYKGKTYVLDYPKEFNGIIMKCLNSDSQKRYKDAKELYNALSDAIERYDPKEELNNQVNVLVKQLKTQESEARQNENRLKQELDIEIQSRLKLKDSFEEQIASIKADALANESKAKQELEKLKSSSAGLTEYYEDQIRNLSSETASKENKLREEIQSKSSTIESLKVQLNNQESKSQEREDNLKQDLKKQYNLNSSLKKTIDELNTRINSLKSQISKSGISARKTISKTFIFVALIFGIITFAIGFFAKDMGIVPYNIKTFILSHSNSLIEDGEIEQGSTDADTIYVRTDTVYVDVPRVIEVPKKEIEYRSSPNDVEKINQLERENRALKAKNKDLQNEINRWEETK